LSTTLARELLRPLRGLERDLATGIEIRADLARNDHAITTANHLANHLVDEAVLIEEGRVEMIDAEIDGSLQ
jgi:hypothetical protein